LKHKSDVESMFLQFQTQVERFLNKKILTVQSDSGGEYLKLHKYFSKVGIKYQLSSPHTHQQNGLVERKHRHIVETGITLLAQPHMPVRFWDDAFQSACFLINRLPSRTINNETPIFRLLGSQPDYKILRVFGSACWPNLRAYNSKKLSFRSKQCVFIGYSPNHKGYKCLDRETGRVYISRDVVFDENQFPFKTIPDQNQNTASADPQPISLPTVCYTEEFLTDIHPTIESVSNSSSPSSPVTNDLLTEVEPSQPVANESAGVDLSIAGSEDDTMGTSTTPSVEQSETAEAVQSVVQPLHQMRTRLRDNIVKPKEFTDGTVRYNTAATLENVAKPVTEPGNLSEALKYKEWRQAMDTEYAALLKNQT
jgi:histone deacetylase 1/2